MGLTCPNCGNERSFLAKTLQTHVVQSGGKELELTEQSRPAVFEGTSSAWCQLGPEHPSHAAGTYEGEESHPSVARQLARDFTVVRQQRLTPRRRQPSLV